METYLSWWKNGGIKYSHNTSFDSFPMFFVTFTKQKQTYWRGLKMEGEVRQFPNTVHLTLN